MRRSERMGDEIKRILAELISQKLNDTRITRADTTVSITHLTQPT